MTGAATHPSKTTRWVALIPAMMVVVVAGWAVAIGGGLGFWRDGIGATEATGTTLGLLVILLATRRTPGAVIAVGISGAAMMANGMCEARDAWAVAMAMWAWSAGVVGWGRVALIGAACGLSPLAAGAMFGLFAGRRSVARRWGAVGVSVAVATLATFLLRPFGTATDVPEVLARLGPQNVWRGGAEALDILTPVVVLGAVAVWLRLDRGAPSSDDPELAERIDLDRTDFDRADFDRAAIAWLVANILWSLWAPRVAIAHMLVTAAPLIALADGGWNAFRLIRMNRTSSAATLFAVAAHLALAWLMWTPIRTVAEALLAAAW